MLRDRERLRQEGTSSQRVDKDKPDVTPSTVETNQEFSTWSLNADCSFRAHSGCGVVSGLCTTPGRKPCLWSQGQILRALPSHVKTCYSEGKMNSLRSEKEVRGRCVLSDWVLA